jgi:type I restriction enzyme S subunit
VTDEGIRPGYKQTEVGVIPEDWEAALAKDVLRISRGRVISHQDISRSPGPFPVYSSQTKDNGVMGYLSTYDFEGEYLTWTTDGANAGTVFYRAGKFNCTNVCGVGMPQQPSRTSVAFFAYFLDTVAWKYVSHVGNPKLMSGPFGTIPVVVPPENEQRAIAQALADADELIASLEAVIAKKRDLKQAAMQNLLTGKTRLPGFSGEWEVKRIGEVSSIQRGASPRPIDSPIWFDELSRIGWVRISDVSKSDMFLSSTTQRLSPLGVERSRQVEVGSLIMSIAATVGRPAITQIDCCIHDGFVVFSNLKLEKTFFYFVLRDIEPKWSKQGQTGSQMNLNTAMIGGTEIMVPPTIVEQAAIAEVLSDMDADLAALKAQASKARAVKQGMMQELLTGRVRLV